MKIAIIGMGGIGGLVGASLANKYNDIYFIARGENLKAIREKGLTLQSDCLGAFTAHPALATDNVAEIGAVDVLIIATKSYGLEAACKQCLPIIEPDTMVLPLQNGVAIAEDVIAYTGGAGQTAEGCIYCFSNLAAPGRITHIGDMRDIDFGFKDGRKTQTGKKLEEMLNSVGIRTHFSEDAFNSIWKKYIMMGGNSCAFAYFESDTGAIQADPVKAKYIHDVYEEMYHLAIGEGADIPESIVQEYTDKFMAQPKDSISSLYRDIRDGKENTEFDAIIGKAYRIAEKQGAAAPCIRAMYHKYKG